jgi:PAS domain S-box-containing protein
MHGNEKVTDGGGVNMAFNGLGLNEEIEILKFSHIRDLFFDHINIWVCVLDPEFNILYWNKAAERMSGYTHDEAVGHAGVWELLYPDGEYRAEVWRRAAEVVENGNVLEDFESSILAKDGRKKIMQWQAKIIFNSDNKPLCSMVMARDITEKKDMASELLSHRDRLLQLVEERTAKLDLANQKLKREIQEHRKSEQRFRSIVEGSHDGIVIIDDHFRFIYVNDQFAQMVGYDREEIKGDDFRKFITEDSLAKVVDRYQRRQRGEQVPPRYEFNLLTKDGDSLNVEISSSIIKEHGGKVRTVAQMLDISGRKKLEAQLLQSRKMESIGTLAGGLAHDFNNLLMGILGNISLMLVDTDPSNPHYDKLKNMEHLVQSGADINRQLLGFARGGKYESRITDINELIRRNAHMFGRTRKEIKMNIKLQENSWLVDVDQGQMEQVFLNLYVNAWQAMPGGGNLYIQTKNSELDAKRVDPYDVKPGKYLKISVTDTGEGMEPAVKERIFDPFFTTREMGRGTGLGLASVYGIVRNHGGFIEVYSEKGIGSNFNIFLPVSEGAMSQSLNDRGGDNVLMLKETVLLVDDEEMILEVGGEMLMELGCEVITAGSGQEALDIYREKQERISLVLLDMVMPGMGGDETYDQLKEIDPNVKALLCSGYSLNDRAESILRKGCNGFIQKPFSLEELSRKIREVSNS